MTEYVYDRIGIFLTQLYAQIFTNSVQLEGILSKSGHFNTPSDATADPTPWKEWNRSSRWGGRDTHHHFRLSFTVPKTYDGKALALLVKTDKDGWLALNPQFLLFVNGQIKQGLDTNHQWVFLSESGEAGREYCLDFAAWSGMEEASSTFGCELVEFDHRSKDAFFDLWVAYESVKLMTDGNRTKIELTNVLDEAINIVDARVWRSEAYYASLEAMRSMLQEKIYTHLAGKASVSATAVGHAHIDLAWLWQIAQTRKKAARTFASAIELGQHYPEFVFMASQPQLYQYIEEDHPDLFARIKALVEEGKWETEGGMWVESDCNLTSGESMVRQIVHAKRYFAKHFGTDTRIAWLPDAFGYNAAMPQILKKAGIDYFMTTKINWNQQNQIPYNSFYWQGIDGSEVLSHIITTVDETIRFKYNDFLTTYNGMLEPKSVKSAWDRYLSKDVSDEVLISYGYGDGGGGVTWHMLEIARRLRDGFYEVPQVKCRKSLDFFNDLESQLSAAKHTPRWVGELYLEYHRGTLTSMARNKRSNRRLEFMLQEAEWLCAMGYLSGKEYPEAELYDLWRIVLYNQFHDILPGSSIREVYEDSDREYQEVTQRLTRIIDDRTHHLAGGEATTGAVAVFNPLSFQRSDVVVIKEGKGKALVDGHGTIYPLQSNSLAEGTSIAYLKDLPSLGYATFTVQSAEGTGESPLSISTKKMENPFFSIEFDERLEISSLYDKRAQREVVTSGRSANQLIAYEDRPMDNENWDIEAYYVEKYWNVDNISSVTVVEEGPIRGGVRITRTYSNSSLVQYVFIYRDIPRIDFITEVDWREDQTLLRVLFPVDVHSNQARFDIPFGSIVRNTYRNTSWEKAAFEVPVYKWMDLSERDYGVALLNDCKYGASVTEGVLGLSLIKSGMWPYDKADREVHHFSYSLYPHQGDWATSEVNAMSLSFNRPLNAMEGAKTGQLFSLLSVDQSNVVIESVKKAYEGDQIIVRLHEHMHSRTRVTITTEHPLTQVSRCNLLEEEAERIPFNQHSFSLVIEPFEVVTIALGIKRGEL